MASPKSDLQQGVGVLQEPSGDGVPRLMICHRLLLLRLQNLSLLLQTSNTQEAQRQVYSIYNNQVATG